MRNFYTILSLQFKSVITFIKELPSASSHVIRH